MKRIIAAGALCCIVPVGAVAQACKYLSPPSVTPGGYICYLSLTTFSETGSSTLMCNTGALDDNQTRRRRNRLQGRRLLEAADLGGREPQRRFRPGGANDVNPGGH